MADNKKVLYEFNEDSENGVFMIEVEEAVAESNHDYYDENATRGGDDKSEKENKKVATTFEKANINKLGAFFSTNLPIEINCFLENVGFILKNKLFGP